MLAALFTGGIDIFAFYALQPYLLELWGDRKAFGIAGLAAAIVAGSEMVAGFLVPYAAAAVHPPHPRAYRRYRIGAVCLALMGLFSSFWVAIGLLVVWGLTFSVAMPIRQAYINGLIPTQQRATMLSFDNLMASAGGVATQPALGRAADVWGYPTAYVLCGVIQLAALPFLLLARREKAKSDPIEDGDAG